MSNDPSQYAGAEYAMEGVAKSTWDKMGDDTISAVVAPVQAGKGHPTSSSSLVTGAQGRMPMFRARVTRPTAAPP
jgi:hypothetical protein